jgi:hypothetical protein
MTMKRLVEWLFLITFAAGSVYWMRGEWSIKSNIAHVRAQQQKEEERQARDRDLDTIAKSMAHGQKMCVAWHHEDVLYSTCGDKPNNPCKYDTIICDEWRGR